VTLADGTSRMIGGSGSSNGHNGSKALNGGSSRLDPPPSLIVFFSPSCGACEALPDAITKLVRERGRGEIDVIAVISGTEREEAARYAAEHSLTDVAVVASGDFPEYYIPRNGVPFAVALSGDGQVAAKGKPRTFEHLREMAYAARHMAELATTHSFRDHEWGQSAPYWENAAN
jgi:thiol-disulfide isomerase/thioredoxin